MEKMVKLIKKGKAKFIDSGFDSPDVCNCDQSLRLQEELTTANDRIKELAEWKALKGSSIHGGIVLQEMLTESQDRIKELEAGLRDLARGPLQEPMEFEDYVKSRAKTLLGGNK